jgi:predicted flavoprotein YhiN
MYPLSPEIRAQLIQNKTANILIDFKPDLSLEEIKNRIENKGKLSIKDVLEKKINLSAIQIELLKLASSKEEYNDVNFLSQLIKSHPLNIIGFAPIDEAISTVGGIPLNEINNNYELIKLSNHYCLGEMLDWDAPTGGYLLQACFSMAKFLADKLNLD